MSRQRTDAFWLWGTALGVLVIGAGVAAYYYTREQAPPSEATVKTPPPAPTVTVPETRAQPSAPPPAIPLPALDQSDADVRGGLTEVAGRDAVARFLVPQRIVRNIVVTIDNASREQMALQQRPIKPTGGGFIVAGGEDAPTIATANYARYAPLVKAVQSVDAKTLVALYRGLKPLFQRAFEDLGHPNDAFDDRLREVIDHLLATPDVPQPVRLVRPSVQYRYADKSLESMSSGRKLLIRMGPDNAAIIKAKLREIRAELG